MKKKILFIYNFVKYKIKYAITRVVIICQPAIKARKCRNKMHWHESNLKTCMFIQVLIYKCGIDKTPQGIVLVAKTY